MTRRIITLAPAFAILIGLGITAAQTPAKLARSVSVSAHVVQR